jgi:hypothetical protein
MYLNQVNLEFGLLCVPAGGKLPVTWYPQDYLQKVPMTNMAMRANPAKGYPGRTYRFYTGPTIHPFGHGLSYTSFTHSIAHAPSQLTVRLSAHHAAGAAAGGVREGARGRRRDGEGGDGHRRVRRAQRRRPERGPKDPRRRAPPHHRRAHAHRHHRPRAARGIERKPLSSIKSIGLFNKIWNCIFWVLMMICGLLLLVPLPLSLQR